MLRMRPNGIVALVVVAAVLGGTAACSSKQAQSGAATETAAMMTPPLQRGAYLVTISGCNDCHTPGLLYNAPDFKRTLAGSDLGWQGPWGVSYASNLTPDTETGLGAWTDAEIERALRSGIKRDGSPVAPPMPWPNYAHYTPEDMAAVIAYLRSVPPVRHKNLGPLPPGQTASGGALIMPAPPAWDAPKETAANPVTK